MLHLQRESILANQRRHLVIAKRHPQHHSITRRRHTRLIQQLRQIRIIFLRLIPLVEESRLQQLSSVLASSVDPHTAWNFPSIPLLASTLIIMFCMRATSFAASGNCSTSGASCCIASLVYAGFSTAQTTPLPFASLISGNNLSLRSNPSSAPKRTSIIFSSTAR